MTNEIEKFLKIVCEKNSLHGKYLKNFLPMLKENEICGLQRLIEFYESLGNSISDIAGCYLLFIQVVMEETMYFAEHGTYRYSTFNEVSRDVYFNDNYMTKYMIGLGLSTYLLNFHLESMRFYDEFIRSVKGSRYLEIGSGHGEYFVKAIELSGLDFFHAVDLSKTCVDMTDKYTHFCCTGRGVELRRDIIIEQRDFFSFVPSEKYDVIVMGEVLEHVEKPGDFLRQMVRCSHEGTLSYVTTVIDAPERDHIYHFHTPGEVFDTVESSGCTIKDYRLVTHNNKPVEKVMKLHQPVLVAMILKI